jgi:hypothetical protein
VSATLAAAAEPSILSIKDQLARYLGAQRAGHRPKTINLS